MQRLQLPQTVRRRPLPAVCRPRATQRQPLLPPPAGTDLWALRGENLICLLCIVEFVFGFGIFFFFGSWSCWIVFGRAEAEVGRKAEL